MSSGSKQTRLLWWKRLRADLRRDPRKRAILLALLPLLVIAWIPVVSGGEDRPVAKPVIAEPTEALAPDTPTTSTTPAPDPGLRDELAVLVSQLERQWTPSWVHDPEDEPFAPAPGPGGSTASGAEGAPAQRVIADASQERAHAATLHPTSTFLSSSRDDVVVIGGQPYRCGERIGHFVIREIAARSVVVEGRFDSYELRIPLRKERRP